MLETETLDRAPTLAQFPTRSQVDALERAILAQPQVAMPVEHSFCNGLYARTMFIPAGTVATGAIHRDESFFVVRSGVLVVPSPEGDRVLPVGHMCVTQAGDKRAVVAVTDVVVTTFHPNQDNETDPQALWDRYTTPPEPPLIAHITKKEVEFQS